MSPMIEDGREKNEKKSVIFSVSGSYERYNRFDESFVSDEWKRGYLDNVNPKYLSFPPPGRTLLTSSLAAQEVMSDFFGRHKG